MLGQIELYFQTSADEFWLCLQQHVEISILSLIVAVAIGIPAGYACTRSKSHERVIQGFFQALRVVPSLAVLILLIPIMGTGVKPAMVALTLLAIPPILMNTVTGFKEVPVSMIEAGRGMGMTEKQILWKVRFPLAMPLIMTGVKTAMIEIIASATIATKIGAGGLGDIIVTGLGLNRTDLLLIGGISVALLSITASLLFNLLDRVLMRYKFVRT